jgi:hypothetical protein
MFINDSCTNEKTKSKRSNPAPGPDTKPNTHATTMSSCVEMIDNLFMGMLTH